MNIFDMLLIASLITSETEKNNFSSCYGECAEDRNKKPESENPVEVCILNGSMTVVFNDVDYDQIKEFIHFIEANPCHYEQEENEFDISANESTLYRILLYLTNEYEEIALY